MRTLIFLAAVCLTAGCSKIWVHPGASNETEPASPDWSYSGPLGPASWGEAYPACGGPAQSPVDIRSTTRRDQPPLEFLYSGVDGVAYDSSEVVRIDVEGGTLEIGERLLTLRRILIHVPSEHHLHGEAFDAEMQLIHVDADTERVAVSVLMQAGEENGFIENVLDQLDGNEEEVELEDLLPDRLDFYSYEGSMTLPPCTPGVRWYVLAEPVELSLEQITALKSLHDQNARPLQPLNGRRVVQSG